MRNLTVLYRVASLFVFGISLLIFHHTWPIGARAYNDLCSSQGAAFGEEPSVKLLGAAFITVVVPTFLASSNAFVIANLVIGLITICFAVSLLHTTANTPYECFT